jgi:hypothetical protein
MLRSRNAEKQNGRTRRASAVQGVAVRDSAAVEADLFPETIHIPPPAVRPLKAYAFDPSRGNYLGNEMTLEVKYEKLLPGPIGSRIAVIDCDGANRVFYRPVDLDDPSILIRGGLNPSESNPRFHQQMVYAVVSETIQHFDSALGRRTRWRLDERLPDVRGRMPNELPGDIHRLNLYPHAMIAANAAYSPSAKGILFGYFRASATDPGRNLPGQTVFTCLSHDIIVHETTHAVLDGIRTYFSERTNPDVPAFHEAFADLAALFRHFSHKEVLLDTVQKTGGRLYQYQLQPEAGTTAEKDARIQAQLAVDNPLIGLAQQFGEARGTGKALRSALGAPADPNLIKDPDLEPHARGAILVAAVFDAYFTIYIRRTADLFRIFRAGGGSANPVELPGPMANLLADAASRTASQFFQICVRAIDYCPPVDITFGDYLRAIMTSDRDRYPTDEMGVRDALMQAFRLRGILPDDASYFSEESLCWPQVPPGRLPAVEGLIFGDPNGLTDTEKDRNGEVLRTYAKTHAAKLGFRPDLYISVPSFHPMFRLAPDGSLHTDMVVEMSQIHDVPFDPEKPELGNFPMRGGVTLLIAKPPRQHGKYPPGEIRYLIEKRLDGNAGMRREERQRRYCLREGLLEGSDPKRFQLDFNMLHGSI